MTHNMHLSAVFVLDYGISAKFVVQRIYLTNISPQNKTVGPMHTVDNIIFRYSTWTDSTYSLIVYKNESCSIFRNAFF